MKRTLLISLVCIFALSINAQFDKQALSDYTENVNTFMRAVNEIVKDGKYEEGVTTITSLIEHCEENASYPPEKLGSYYCLRGQGKFFMKQYEQATEDYKHALELLQESGDIGKPDLSNTWYQLSTTYYYYGKKEEAMDAANNCIQSAKDYYGVYHSTTLDAYSLRSNLAGFYSKKDIALSDRQRVFEIIQKNIERNFVYFTASERSAYWNKHLPETTKMFTFAHMQKEWEGPFVDALFDQQLLAKGLLITAESSLQRAIDSDPSLNETYQKIRRLRTKALDVNASPKDIDNATLEADRLERQLGTTANSLHQFLDFLKVHTGDVRAKLKPTDIAIEFVDYRVGKDSTMYGALILSPLWQHAHFLPLIEAREIPNLSENLIEKLWKPILDIVGNDVRDIYFSPTGLLYQLPIESHLLPDKQPIGEKFHMHRLSSTRWLSMNRDKGHGKDAVIYGGLAYDTSASEMQQDTKPHQKDREIESSAHKTRSAIMGLEYLPGTKTEAESIAKAINAAAKEELHADLLMGKNGTEPSFKRLDGQHKQIVHIATHGFYDDSEKNATTDALSRCGLFFAGADNALSGEAFPSGGNDGILTAQEISSLDLRGLNLVTLSACQTGQGQITSDGVFGLQRGFKKAGAQSILMSLWKVDDEATCLLMTEFYKNWIGKNKTKHDALELAKQIVRTHKEKGWDDPKYWAAFIMLDGLD